MVSKTKIYYTMLKQKKLHLIFISGCALVPSLLQRRRVIWLMVVFMNIDACIASQIDLFEEEFGQRDMRKREWLKKDNVNYVSKFNSYRLPFVYVEATPITFLHDHENNDDSYKLFLSKGRIRRRWYFKLFLNAVFHHNHLSICVPLLPICELIVQDLQFISPYMLQQLVWNCYSLYPTDKCSYCCSMIAS